MSGNHALGMVLLTMALGLSPVAAWARPVPDKISSKTSKDQDPVATLQEQLARELGAAAVPEEDAGADPMLSLVRRMREIEERLGRADCGPATQKSQKQIVADLDALIRKAGSCSGSCSGSGRPKPSGAQCRAGAKPGSRPGQGEPKKGGSGRPTTGAVGAKKPGPHRPDMVEMRTLLKQLWGELPEHQREEMLQLPVEEFLPEYEDMIEDYFERLSEE